MDKITNKELASLAKKQRKEIIRLAAKLAIIALTKKKSNK